MVVALAIAAVRLLADWHAPTGTLGLRAHEVGRLRREDAGKDGDAEVVLGRRALGENATLAAAPSLAVSARLCGRQASIQPPR
jgi:hypothetical protein